MDSVHTVSKLLSVPALLPKWNSKLVHEKIDAYSKITFISGKLIINLTLTKNQNWSLDFVTGVLTVQINMSV